MSGVGVVEDVWGREGRSIRGEVVCLRIRVALRCAKSVAKPLMDSWAASRSAAVSPALTTCFPLDWLARGQRKRQEEDPDQKRQAQFQTD